MQTNARLLIFGEVGPFAGLLGSAAGLGRGGAAPMSAASKSSVESLPDEGGGLRLRNAWLVAQVEPAGNLGLEPAESVTSGSSLLLWRPVGRSFETWK